MSPTCWLLAAILLFDSSSSGSMNPHTISLAGVPFTSVFDFESPVNDRVFLRGKYKFEKSAAFTGKYGVNIPANQSIRIRIGAALVGREFPGRWKYLGFYTRPTDSARLKVRWHDADQIRDALLVDLETPTREWIELFKPVNLETLELELINESTEAASVGIDDFILCDPDLVVQKFEAGTIGLERTGLGWYVETTEGRQYVGRWDPMSNGVNPVEWSSLRVIFSDTTGVRFSYDSRGHRRPPDESEPLLEVQVIEDCARIDRNSTGDSNQDGYDEVTGSYQIHAFLPTVLLRVAPLEKPVDRTLIEVDNLPPGEVRVTIEGALVDRIHRFKDGRVLVELPITIDRPMQIEIRSIQIK